MNVDLEERLPTWVAAGLLSGAQARAILAHEAARRSRAAEADAGADARADPRASRRARAASPSGGRRLPLVAEALGYLGAVLAVVAAILTARRFWADLDVWARVALLGLAAALLLAAGVVTPAVRHAALWRLRAVLWAGSTVAVAGALGLFAADVVDLRPSDVALVASAGTSVYAAALLRAIASPLQHVVLLAALAATVVAAVTRTPHVDPAMVGLGLWALGGAWGLLVWGGLLSPDWTGYAGGAVLLIVGGQIAASQTNWGHGLAIATTVGLLALSVLLRQVLLLAAGAVSVVVEVPHAVAHYFWDTLGASVVLFLTGLALLAAALVVARLREYAR